LRAAASRPNVATVTPLSDNAGAFSAPVFGRGNELPPGYSEASAAKMIRRNALRLYPTVPTGNGYCMYLNRECLNEIGLFDEQSFPRGYGEENDFCMRAVRAGWCHVVDDCTYVFHERSKSFGEAKTDLIKTGRAIVDERYPEYKTAIQVFQNGNSLRLARFQVARALKQSRLQQSGFDRLLYVVSTQTGGTPQTNMDLMKSLGADFEPWLLRCDSQKLVLSRLTDGQLEEVNSHVMEEQIDPICHLSDEYDQIVESWLQFYDFKLVHIRHLAWHSLNLPKIAKRQGCGVVNSFHDFYAACPTVKLLTDGGEFCGGNCIAKPGSCSQDLWKVGMPPLSTGWISHWRERFSEALSWCDAFVTTSESAKSTIIGNLPSLSSKPFYVIPHGRNFEEFKILSRKPRFSEPIRILVPGNINKAKGLLYIEKILNIDSSGLIEFHILGRIDKKSGVKHERIIEHGEYKRDEFAERVEEIRPNFGAVFSIWDETYCHTLTELWSVGIAAFVFDFPTVANRTVESGCGWVLKHDDLDSLYKNIIEIAFNNEEQKKVGLAISQWQSGYGLANTTNMMSGRYLQVYNTVLLGNKNIPLVGVHSGPPKESQHTPHRIVTLTKNEIGRKAIYVRMDESELIAAANERLIDAGFSVMADTNFFKQKAILNSLSTNGIPYTLDVQNLKIFDYTESEIFLNKSMNITTHDPLIRSKLKNAKLSANMLKASVSEGLVRGIPTGNFDAGKQKALFCPIYNSSLEIDDALLCKNNKELCIDYFNGEDIVLHGDIQKAENLTIKYEQKRNFWNYLKIHRHEYNLLILPTQVCDDMLLQGIIDTLGLGCSVITSDLPTIADFLIDVETARLLSNDSDTWNKYFQTDNYLKLIDLQSAANRKKVFDIFDNRKNSARLDSLVFGE
jgi:glycosyltransferase involved in cell wall biosynthesis